MDVDEIQPGLLIGSCPACAGDIERLSHDLGVTALLNLQTDEDLRDRELEWAELEELYRRAAIRVRRVPVRDFDPEDLRRNLPTCVAALSELVDQGHVVYVHCNMGMGRSPSVVIAYLHWGRQWDLDEAFGHVNRCRPCLPDLEAIRLAAEGR